MAVAGMLALSGCSNDDEPLRYAARTLIAIRTMKGQRYRT